MTEVTIVDTNATTVALLLQDLGTTVSLPDRNWTDATAVSETFLPTKPNYHVEVLLVSPDWSLVRYQLRWMWTVHTYGFACLFFMLAFYTFFSILNLRAQLSSRPFMSTINVFLCLLGTSRAMAFLIDPYNSKGIMPEAIGAIMWDLAFPCLLSGFSLVQLAFLQLTQLKLGPAKLRSKSCLSLVISIHFCLTIATNILWSFQDRFKVLCYISQGVFSCWGTFLCATFLYGGYRTMKLLKLVPPLLFPRFDSTTGYENKGILQLSILAKCNNLASVAATVAAPAMVMPPKIRITDETEQTYSFISDTPLFGHTTTEGLDNETKANIADKSPVEEKPTPTEQDEQEEEPEVCTQEQMRMLGNEDEHSEQGNLGPCTNNDHSIHGRSPHRVRISSVPRIIQNGSPYKTKEEVRKQAEQDDQLEMNLLGKGGKWGRKLRGPDQTLTSVLNHIAYVDQAMDDYKIDTRRLKPTRRSQIQKVLRATYITASLGLLICLLQLYGICGPYGMWASDERPSPWPWFVYQTLFRLAEFAMGCLMANITKQPVNRHHFPYSCHLHQRETLCY